jgi:hypothetical protein
MRGLFLMWRDLDAGNWRSQTSVRGRIAAVGTVIGVVAVAAPVVIRAVIPAGPKKARAATETSVVVEATAGPGEVLTRKGAAESRARTAEMAATESAAHMSASEPTAHMSTAETATHMSATTETAPVSTPTSAATRKRISGQSPGESGGRSQNDHDLT